MFWLTLATVGSSRIGFRPPASPGSSSFAPSARGPAGSTPPPLQQNANPTELGPQRVEARRLQVEGEPLLLLQLLQERVELLRRVDQVVVGLPVVVGAAASRRRRRCRRSVERVEQRRLSRPAAGWSVGWRLGHGAPAFVPRLADRRQRSPRSACAPLAVERRADLVGEAAEAALLEQLQQPLAVPVAAPPAVPVERHRHVACRAATSLRLSSSFRRRSPLERLLHLRPGDLVDVGEQVVERAELLEQLGGRLRRCRARRGRCPPSRRRASGSRPPAPA